MEVTYVDKMWGNPFQLEEPEGNFWREAANTYFKAKDPLCVKNIFRTCKVHLGATGWCFWDTSMKYGKLNCGGKNELQLPGRCRLWCDKAPETAAVLWEKIKDTHGTNNYTITEEPSQ